MTDHRPAGRLPDFLIAGEAKCGTTTLWELLGRHPRVFFPRDKELHFFSSYSDFPGHGRLQTSGLDPYLLEFAYAEATQICGEATPNYLFDELACERIYSVLPSVRIVVILRDPIARAWSHYWHHVRRGWERLNFDDALEAEEERLQSGDPNMHAKFSYVARGRYVESLQRYERTFSRGQLCVVFLEDLHRDPRAVIRRVCGDIGLTAPEGVLDGMLPHANKAEFPRWPRLDAATRSVRRWVDARAPSLAFPLRPISRATRRFRVYSGTPRMRDVTRQKLDRAFVASDLLLADWLGQELPWRAWSRQRRVVATTHTND